MPTAIECRQIAAEQRKQSEHATLPNVRSQHLQSAEKWERVADEIDHCCRGLIRANGWDRQLFH